MIERFRTIAGFIETRVLEHKTRRRISLLDDHLLKDIGMYPFHGEHELISRDRIRWR